MKTNENGFAGLLMVGEVFAGVLFAGVLASHMLAGQDKIGEAYNQYRFSGGQLVLMMDNQPKLFNRYRAECRNGDILPDNACRKIATAYKLNGPMV